MGSFYAICSITGKTIVDGDDTVIQFMVPSWNYSHDPSVGQVFVDSFLNTVKKDGLEKAQEVWSQATENWKHEEWAPKGMIVSNESSYRKWSPLGPAIRGKYDDCGDIALSQDEDNLQRVKFLENLLFGVPFKSILDAASDDRWYRLGILKNDKTWKQEGLDDNLLEYSLSLFKMLSVTYFHRSAYDEMKDFTFSAEDGIIDDYEKDWKNKHVENSMTSLSKGLSALLSRARSYLGEKESTDEASLRSLIILKQMHPTISTIYQSCLGREMHSTDFQWFRESLNFMYAMSSMCMELQQSQYGSQHSNWKGWERIERALDLTKKIEEQNV
jgi:hypothetical protein